MFPVGWDQEEMVALVDLYFRTQQCSRLERSNLIDELSRQLNRRADVLSIPRDAFFRNHNGIVMMLMNLRSIALNGAIALDATSKLMIETWKLYHEKYEKFQGILYSFQQKYSEKELPKSLRRHHSDSLAAKISNNITNNLILQKSSTPSSQNEDSIHDQAFKKNEIGYGLTKYLAEQNISPCIKLSEYLECQPSNWALVGIEDLSLSVRACNCIRSKSSTLEELLELRMGDIASITGMGIKSFTEIIDTLRKLVKNEKGFKGQEDVAISTSSDTSQELRQYQADIINGRWESIDDTTLSSNGREQLLALKSAYELLGADFVHYFSLNSSQVSSVLEEIMTQMAHSINVKVRLRSLIEQLPPDRLHKKAVGFITAKYPDNPEMQNLLFSYFEDEECSLKSVLKNKNYIQQHLNTLYDFLEWCSFDIENEVKEMATLFGTNERNLEILRIRSNGATLNDVGNAFNLTRERVRQIENKLSFKFGKMQKKYHTLLKISALRNDDTILTTEEIKPYLGEYAELLLYLFKITPSTDYAYKKNYNAFIIGLANVEKQVEDYVDNLPEQFATKELDILLVRAEQEYALPKELVALQIESVYNHNDVVFYRGSLSSGEMCAKVLAKYYPEGIHVYDDNQIAAFRDKVFEEFGNAARIAENTRAVAARISSVGILCGRGMYKAKANLSISDALLEEIKQFILDYEYPIILMNVLFSQFSEKLQAEGVDNKYYLQGILKERYSDIFYFRRDYVSRDAESTSFYAAVIDYIHGFDYPISKAQIYNAFPGISEIIINLTIMDESILNYFGEYLHVDHLKIEENELNILKKHISDLLNKEGTCNSRSLYSYVVSRMPYALKKWYIRFHFQFFSLCEYLFKDQFQFSRPYLAPMGTEITYPNQQALEYLRKSKETSVSDLFEFLQSKQIRIMDALKYINSLNDEYLLINQEALMNIDDIGVTEEHCHLIEELINDEISECVPIKELVCTFHFPKLRVRWTDWLIYSILNKWATKVDVFTSYSQFRYSIPLVAPKGMTATENTIGKPNTSEPNTFVFDDFDEDIEDIIVEYLEEGDDEFI